MIQNFENYLIKFNKLLKLLLVNLILIPISTSSLFADGIYEGSINNKRTITNPQNEKINEVDFIENKSSRPKYSLSDSELSKYQYCGKDSDCMQVINGCCQCMQGDPFTAINKEMLAEFMNKFSCEKVICPEDSKDYSCNDGVVSCINFKCQYLSAL